MLLQKWRQYRTVTLSALFTLLMVGLWLLLEAIAADPRPGQMLVIFSMMPWFYICLLSWSRAYIWRRGRRAWLLPLTAVFLALSLLTGLFYPEGSLRTSMVAFLFTAAAVLVVNVLAQTRYRTWRELLPSLLLMVLVAGAGVALALMDRTDIPFVVPAWSFLFFLGSAVFTLYLAQWRAEYELDHGLLRPTGWSLPLPPERRTGWARLAIWRD